MDISQQSWIKLKFDCSNFEQGTWHPRTHQISESCKGKEPDGHWEVTLKDEVAKEGRGDNAANTQNVWHCPHILTLQQNQSISTNTLKIVKRKLEIFEIKSLCPPLLTIMINKV